MSPYCSTTKINFSARDGNRQNLATRVPNREKPHWWRLSLGIMLWQGLWFICGALLQTRTESYLSSNIITPEISIVYPVQWRKTDGLFMHFLSRLTRAPCELFTSSSTSLHTRCSVLYTYTLSAMREREAALRSFRALSSDPGHSKHSPCCTRRSPRPWTVTEYDLPNYSQTLRGLGYNMNFTTKSTSRWNTASSQVPVNPVMQLAMNTPAPHVG